MGGWTGCGRGTEAGTGDVDLDLVADVEAHMPPRGSSMTSLTTLHTGRPWMHCVLAH